LPAAGKGDFHVLDESILIIILIVILFGNTASSERALNSLETDTRPFGQRAFPNSTNAPTCGAQNSRVAAIPPCVAIDLTPPGRRVSLWPQIPAAFVAVPEAAVHEDGKSCVQENEVRFASQRIIALPAMDSSFSQKSHKF
jgi:hypothetical protein